ncbi:hypothetical protein CASFOL_017390 [Castilleja foliolosa]|uniref:SnoaL-like domain-containing protein n=1 Tax=Castilleja foliolosa TaxID=1961234 RepID=A0ABD3DBH2_9LAMI
MEVARFGVDDEGGLAIWQGDEWRMIAPSWRSGGVPLRGLGYSVWLSTTHNGEIATVAERWRLDDLFKDEADP